MRNKLAEITTNHIKWCWDSFTGENTEWWHVFISPYIIAAVFSTLVVISIAITIHSTFSEEEL